MSAEDVMASHGQRYDEDLTAWLSCTCGWRIDTEHIDYSCNPDMQADRQYAAHLLDALRSNGFEVVELPEPIHRCPRDAAWMTKDEALQVDSDRRSGIALSYLDVDLPVYGPWSAVEARDLAAALLAAARHAGEWTP